jgi:NodT family efflux transporter outer membrane factor (OMF) lipoprotein
MIRPRSRATLRLAALAGTILAAAGCSVGPDYKAPSPIVSARFKELQVPPGWVRAAPRAAELPKGSWWTIYNDPTLNALEAQVDLNNQNIRQYEANYRQARAIVDEARANYFPTLSVTPSVTRSQSGGSGVSVATASGTTAFSSGRAQTNYQLEGNASWDLDLWGKVRRQVESDVASAQASAAELANMRLSYEATLASDYFQLRYEDSLQALLDRTVTAYAQSLQITQNQYNAGTAAPSDLLQAQTLLQTTKAEAINVGVARAQYEHAIAVLTGQPPAALSLPTAPLTAAIPPVPVTVPSLLLQRRPDIAEAERTMQEQNALIGVQIAAFYPDVSLSALYGYSGNPIGSLIQLSNRVWSLGASATEDLFEGGGRSAAVRAARAAYDSSVASYRQTVLTAFQDVEDALSSLRIYEQQAQAQQEAVDLANRAVQVSLNEYQAGTTAYTTVITSETTALSDAQSALSIQLNRLTTSVSLVQQMGGGWDASRIPSRDAMETNPLLPGFLDKPLPPAP